MNAKHLPSIVIVAAAAFAGIGTGSSGATSRSWRDHGLCLDSTATLGAALVDLRAMATTSDTAVLSERTLLHLSSADPDTIRAISDSTMCGRAAASFRHAKYGADTGSLVSVFLIRYDSTKYVASNLSRMGEWTSWAVMDSSFTILATIGW
jgi:hypothetical protein